MKQTLSKSEMLALWKRRHFLEPLRADCRISRSDGVDIDAIAEHQMRNWYLDMLANAPVGQIAPEDVTKSSVVTLSQNGTVLIALPDNVVRLIALKFDGWLAEAQIVMPGSPMAKRQANIFARGGVCAPVAIVNSNRSVEVFSPRNTGIIPIPAYILVARDTGPETYTLDESGFASL